MHVDQSLHLELGAGDALVVDVPMRDERTEAGLDG
jgi:hypothetical protein